MKEAQTAEAPAAEEQDVPQDPKAKKEWFGKKAAKELAAEKARADAAEQAAAQAKDQLLRTAAEYDNFRRRSAKEQDAAFNNGVGFAVNQILTILDTLEMAANAACTDEHGCGRRSFCVFSLWRQEAGGAACCRQVTRGK